MSGSGKADAVTIAVDAPRLDAHRMRWLGAFAICLVLAGCGWFGSTATPANHVTSIATGKSSQQLRVDGRERTYHLYRPAALPARAPLVVMLHGGYGSGTQAEDTYGWDAVADQQHFLVAYPDGLNKAWNVDGGGCCGPPARQHVDDVAFLRTMVATIEKQASIDPKRIYVTGISNGGIMAYTLACRTSLFAAVGADSATMLASCNDPPKTSVLHIHGTADTRIPYGGGEGQGSAHIDGPSVPTVNQTWRTIDDCAAPTSTVAGAVTTSTASCPDGRTVELITIAGAGHQWPGSPARPAREKLLGTDPPYQGFSATAVFWAFFAAHHG